MPNALVHHQFEDAEQQHEAAGLGMWTFLVTEMLFFAGLFLLYAVYRWQYADAFVEAGSHLYLSLGATNLTILLVSSLTMALGVQAAQANCRARTLRLLLMTLGLGCMFLLCKATEYYLDYRDGIIPGQAFKGGWKQSPGHIQLFFVMYFIMTGVHALHVLTGVLVISVVIVRCSVGEQIADKANTVEMFGLYWHFVDCVWIVLFPLLYLGGH